MDNIKPGHFLLVALAILCIFLGTRWIPGEKSQGVFSEQDLQAMQQLDTNNLTILRLREENKLLMLTVGEKNLPDKLLNPDKYYDCTYSGCTSLLASGATQ